VRSLQKGLHILQPAHRLTIERNDHVTPDKPAMSVADKGPAPLSQMCPVRRPLSLHLFHQDTLLVSGKVHRLSHVRRDGQAQKAQPGRWVHP
jgi:hypothetical protein